MEVIVVDDASAVGVAAACATLAASRPAPTVIRNRVTLGRARSRNLGAAAGRGEILVFIDSDDVPTPDYVDRIATRLSSAGPHVALRTNMRVHEDLTGRSHFARFQDSRHVGSRIAAGRFAFDAGTLPPKFVSTSCLALWKRDFDSLGGFDETFVAYGGEDEEFGLRMHAAGMIVAFAPDALIWDGDGATSLDRLCARIPEYVQVGLRRVVEKHPEYVRLSRYARLAFSDDGGTAALIAGLVMLRRLGAIAAIRWVLTRIDGAVDLRVPHRLYELVIAAEVAAARPRGTAFPPPPASRPDAVQ
jgi:GT2 family glycosyltransferase